MRKCNLLILVLIPLFCIAQTSKELEKKRLEIERQIAEADKQLKETTRKKKNSITQLEILKKKIKDRKRLIRSIEKEVDFMEDKIYELEQTIGSKEKRVKQLQDDYARIIQKVHKAGGKDQFMSFIFAAEDFNQAYQRIRYLQQYSSNRKILVESIRQQQDSLLQIKEEKIQIKNAKLELLSEKKSENKKLSNEEKQKNQTVKTLSSQESELNKKIAANKKERERLNKAIEEAIKKEIEKEKSASETEAERVMTGDFASNKGKLPSPVRGIITGKFGKVEHPDFKGVIIENNGIDISTSEGSEVTASFKGTVSKVIIIPNAGKAVLVRHGNYRTVYHKLKEVYVKPGQEITAGQKLGSVLTDKASGESIFHFEIWKGTNKIDPLLWINQGSI